MSQSLLLQHHLDLAIGLVGTLKHKSPHSSIPPGLDALFAELSQPSPTRSIEEIEDDIWERWVENSDEELSERMQHAIAAIGQQAWSDAAAVINNLLRDCPMWAEAWNKRASMLHLIGEDAQSVSDICKTLELEPRHFGALTALGKICLRHDQAQPALIVFDSALNVNPHLHEIRKTAEHLRRETRLN